MTLKEKKSNEVSTELLLAHWTSQVSWNAEEPPQTLTAETRGRATLNATNILQTTAFQQIRNYPAGQLETILLAAKLESTTPVFINWW